MATFKKRTTAPSTDSKYWKHISVGGVNSCIHIKDGSCIPNCVGYAWGRWYELLGTAPKLSRGNAENWYTNTADGYKRGKTPKVGAVICWRKGKAGVNSDGAGHVAVVEAVNSNGSILISESGYNAFRFRTRTLQPPFSIGSAYTFQGFIYNPMNFQETKLSAKVTFIKGVQKATGSKVDGKAGSETLSNTITVSATKNSRHPVVKVIQTYLNHLGYNCGEEDGIAGRKFANAVKQFQFAKGCVCDGEITKGGKTWQKLLGMA